MEKIINLLIEIKNEIEENELGFILDDSLRNEVRKYYNSNRLQETLFEDILEKIIDETFILKLSQIISNKLHISNALSIIDEYSNYVYELIIIGYKYDLEMSFYEEVYELLYNQTCELAS